MFNNVTATIIILSTKLSHLSLSCFPRFQSYNIWLWSTTGISIRPNVPNSKWRSAQRAYIGNTNVCGVQGEAINMQLESKNKNAVHLNLLGIAYFVLHCSFFSALGWFSVISYHHQPPCAVSHPFLSWEGYRWDDSLFNIWCWVNVIYEWNRCAVCV